MCSCPRPLSANSDPHRYFGGRATSFGILKRPRKEDNEAQGEEEQICLSILVPGIPALEFNSAVGELIGFPSSSIMQFPESWGPNPLDKANPGDFSLPMKFPVDMEAQPDEPARRSVDLLRRRRDESTSEPSGTIVARQAGFLDTLVSPTRGLANL